MGFVVALALLWGCHQLIKLGIANNHPQKNIYRVKRGSAEANNSPSHNLKNNTIYLIQ